MAKSKIAISIEDALVQQLDDLVAAGAFPSRSRAIERAVEREVERRKRTRLARECAKVNPAEERALAEEGLAADVAAWPEY